MSNNLIIKLELHIYVGYTWIQIKLSRTKKIYRNHVKTIHDDITNFNAHKKEVSWNKIYILSLTSNELTFAQD